jgi:hypothetical protein
MYKFMESEVARIVNFRKDVSKQLVEILGKALNFLRTLILKF